MSNVMTDAVLRFKGSLNPNARIADAAKNRLDEIEIQREKLAVEEETLKNLLAQMRVCPKCNGTGLFDDKQCPQCGGKGMLV